MGANTVTHSAGDQRHANTLNLSGARASVLRDFAKAADPYLSVLSVGRYLPSDADVLKHALTPSALAWLGRTCFFAVDSASKFELHERLIRSDHRLVEHHAQNIAAFLAEEAHFWPPRWCEEAAVACFRAMPPKRQADFVAWAARAGGR